MTLSFQKSVSILNSLIGGQLKTSESRKGVIIISNKKRTKRCSTRLSSSPSLPLQLTLPISRSATKSNGIITTSKLPSNVPKLKRNRLNKRQKPLSDVALAKPKLKQKRRLKNGQQPLQQPSDFTLVKPKLKQEKLLLLMARPLIAT